VTQAPCILVVEDDEPTRTFLADNLTADGYELLVAGSVRDALRQLEYHRVDLAVVDVGLPDGSGLDLVRAVRAATGAGSRLDARLPIVVLSGRASEIDRVRGFERGADDFVAKPFGYGELRLRVAAVLRRARERRGGGRLRVGELAIDPASREVRLRGVPVALSQKEFALLIALRPGHGHGDGRSPRSRTGRRPRCADDKPSSRSLQTATSGSGRRST
jgi:DNA-binding response OmpR family regulator